MKIEIQGVELEDVTAILVDGINFVPDTLTPASEDGYVSEHFREAEFDCNHCGKYGDLISKELLGVLEGVRAHFGAAVTVNSGVRCDYHNKAVGGATNSRHMIQHADAADIVVQDVAPSKVHSYLISSYSGQYGIGKYNSFTHIDVRPGGPARW